MLHTPRRWLKETVELVEKEEEELKAKSEKVVGSVMAAMNAGILSSRQQLVNDSVDKQLQKSSLKHKEME